MRRVDFYSQSSCGPCKMIKPVLNELADAGEINLNYITLEDDGRDAFIEKGVKSTPTLIFYKDDEEVERFSGFLPREQFLEKYNNA